jgi:uncharacterized protein YukE
MRPAPTATVVSSSPATVSPPVRYTVPTIRADPDAVYRLATAYSELAEAVRVARGKVSHVVSDLATAWSGTGQRSIDGPLETFLANAGSLAAALDQAADELEAYARQLATAHHHHRFSLHKLLVIGAITAVSATAIVVTVGAAGVVEAAAATAAVSGATEAAGAATAADVAAAGGLDVALDGLGGLRPLLGFVLPHLVQVEWSTGGMAVYDELTAGRLNWRAIAETGATAFVASGVGAKVTAAAGESGWAPHAVQGTVWASAAAGDDELLDHRLDLSDIAESFVLAGGSTAARDTLRAHGLWVPESDYRREALLDLVGHRTGRITDAAIAHEVALLRQSTRELQRGEINLALHEGPGHTMDRHVAKTAGELLTRVRGGGPRIASTYWDETTAKAAIGETLRANATEVQRWEAAGSLGTLRLRLQTPYDVGFAINRGGRVTFVRQAIVVLRRDHAGVVVVTSYPLSRSRR